MSSAAPTATRFSMPGGLRSPSANSLVALGALALFPLVIALLVANTTITTTLISVSAILLVLVVLWSIEATFYVLILSMLLSPEIVAGGLDQAASTTASRGITLRFDDFVIAIIAAAWLIRLAVFKEAGVLRRSRMNAPILSYIGVCLLATAVAVMFGRGSSLTGFFFVAKYFEYVLIYFLVVNYVRDRSQVKRLLYAAMATAAIISLIVMLQIPGGGRVTAPFEGERGEPNTLGGYLVLMIALALAFASEARTGAQRLAWGSFAGLMMIPLVYTYSRTSWLAFIAMLLATTVLCRTKTLFVVLILLGMILMLISPPQAILERTTYTIAGRPTATGTITIAGFHIEPSAAARLQSWIVAASVVPRRPILGFGVAGFNFIDAQYPRTIIETGLAGLAMFCWVLWALYAMGRELLRTTSHPFDSALAIGFLAALAGMIVHGLGANTFIIVRIMEPFWLVAGLVAALVRIQPQETAHGAAASS